MLDRLQPLAAAIRQSLPNLMPSRGLVLLVGGGAIVAYALVSHPPLRSVGHGEAGVRANQLTGEVTQWGEGSVLVVPFLQTMQVYALRDRIYRPEGVMRADGPSPLQSVEGLSFGADLSVRYALDPNALRDVASKLPEDVDGEVVEPAVSGVIYKVFARYNIREVFSTKRAEIQQAIEKDLRARLASDGIVVRDVLVGKIDLPADYRRGMDALLAEELASEKMRYTLELKDKKVKEVALEGEADKTRREKAAEAAAREQIIAAKAQEEAMAHVLPFKQRQVEQRQLEAEADKQARIRGAEASAQARRIEASGESEAREKLADADAYRVEHVGKANAEQLAREGAIVTAHPLLIQKTLAEKLSDKVQVIIAPPNHEGLISTVLNGGKSQ
jgi:regulator of protease activity HflC (stomatin/prohibitin superfamily)